MFASLNPRALCAWRWRPMVNGHHTKRSDVTRSTNSTFTTSSRHPPFGTAFPFAHPISMLCHSGSAGGAWRRVWYLSRAFGS